MPPEVTQVLKHPDMSSCTGRNPTAAQLLCPASCKPAPLSKGAGLEELIPWAHGPSAGDGLAAATEGAEPWAGPGGQPSLPTCGTPEIQPLAFFFSSYSFSLIHLRSQASQGEVFLLLCVQCIRISSSLQHYSNLTFEHLLGKVEGVTSSTLRNSSWDHPASS